MSELDNERKIDRDHRRDHHDQRTFLPFQLLFQFPDDFESIATGQLTFELQYARHQRCGDFFGQVAGDGQRGDGDRAILVDPVDHRHLGAVGQP